MIFPASVKNMYFMNLKTSFKQESFSSSSSSDLTPISLLLSSVLPFLNDFLDFLTSGAAASLASSSLSSGSPLPSPKLVMFSYKMILRSLTNNPNRGLGFGVWGLGFGVWGLGDRKSVV